MLVLRRLKASTKHKGLSAQLSDFLRIRKILKTTFVPALASDGYITPIGSSFSEGFRIALKQGTPSTRSRFTIYHELCHTFFYEFVPELKFGCFETDEEEERLCNLGAAELLVPARSLKKQANLLSPSIESLEYLAKMYAVSSDMMLLRLRSLKLWHCELSFWRHTEEGSFSLDRMIGGPKLNWAWMDESPLRSAWVTGREVSGRAYVELRTSKADRPARGVCYQVARRGDSLISLWSATPLGSQSEKLPLFESSQLTPAFRQTVPPNQDLTS